MTVSFPPIVVNIVNRRQFDIRDGDLGGGLGQGSIAINHLGHDAPDVCKEVVMNSLMTKTSL